MTKEKILLISAIIFIVAATISVYFWQWSKEKNDEKAVRAVVENFGLALKNVFLLSLTASQDIEQNYKDYVAPELLAEWKADSSKALGRLTSSPWPDRIEITDIKQFSSKGYDVNGNIIEITSVEQTQGGVSAKRPIDLKIEKINDSFLITRVTFGPYDETANWKTFLIKLIKKIIPGIIISIGFLV